MTQQWTFISAGTMMVDAAWRMCRHQHDWNEIVIILRGELVVKGDSGILSGKAGDMFFYPSGTWHEEVNESGKPVEIIFISFKGDAGTQQCVVRDIEARIRTLSGWLLKSRATSYACVERIESSLMGAIAEEFLRLIAYKGVNPIVEKIRSYIYENIQENLTLEQLSAWVNVSKYYFVRAYKEYTGLTPMADVRRIRLEEAHKMVLTTGLPFKAIASATGFANVYHFSEAFKKHFKSSPGAFRR